MKTVFTVLLALLLGIGLVAQNNNYQFQHEVKAEMRQFNADDVEGTYDYSFLFPDDGDYIGLVGDMTQLGQTMKTKAVFDMKAQYIITLLDQGGMKMGMKMSTKQNVPDDVEDLTSYMKIRKTGNSKKILGYECEEYEATDEESYSLIWMSSEVELPNFYDALSAINRQNNELGAEIPKGFMMHMTAWPNGKAADEKVEMLVTEINMNQPQEISTAGYQIMEVPNR